MSLMLFLFAALCGGAFGFFIGLAIADGYQSKKTCRECRRTIVEWGFHSDGKEYVAVEKDKAKKEGLIYCGPCLHSNSAILRKIHDTPSCKPTARCSIMFAVKDNKGNKENDARRADAEAQGICGQVRRTRQDW